MNACPRRQDHHYVLSRWIVEHHFGSRTDFGREVSVTASSQRAKIVYLPGAPAFYANLTAWEHVSFLARMCGLDCTDQIRSLAKKFDLDLARKIRELSKGNQQKVAAENALLRRAVDNGLESVQTHESSLDDIFFSLVSGGDPHGFTSKIATAIFAQVLLAGVLVVTLVIGI